MYTENEMIINNNNTNNNNNIENNYDWKIEINRISDVMNDGWKVTKRTDDFAFKGVRTGIVGFYNKGKTFIFNRLTNNHLPSGYDKTTDFLAIKQVEISGDPYIILDSAGKGQPINMQNNEEHVNRAAVEDMLDCIMASLADYFIIVVNDLTWSDQLFISKIVHQFNKQRANDQTKLIVIHNWYHISLSQLVPHFEQYVARNYKGRTNRNLDELNLENGDTLFWYNTIEQSRKGRVFVDHYFIVGEGPQPLSSSSSSDLKFSASFEKERLHNDKVFDHIRRSFPSFFPRMLASDHHDIESSLLECFTILGRKYLVAEKIDHNQAIHKAIQNKNNIIDNNNCDDNVEVVDDGEVSNDNYKIGAEVYPEFKFENNRYCLTEKRGYKYVCKSIPISVVLSQYPSSIVIPNIIYQVQNDQKKVVELLAHLECPGLLRSSVHLDTSNRNFWKLTITKQKFEYQSTVNISPTNDHLHNPDYGSTEIFIGIPDDFIADIMHYNQYYFDGILMIQILHQSLQGKPYSTFNYPSLVSENSNLSEKSSLSSPSSSLSSPMFQLCTLIVFIIMFFTILCMSYQIFTPLFLPNF